MLKHFATTAIALGVSITSMTALAADSRAIFTAPISAQEASKSKRFAINAELGRAWVEIDVLHDTSEITERYRVQVPGLTYSKDAAQIVYSSGDRSVVCAHVRSNGPWIFKHQRIEPTGNCELTRRYVSVPIDDGFAVDVVEHFEVHFTPERNVGVVSEGQKQPG